MRLIDADALIEAMKKTESEHENAMTCPSWWSAFNAISEQPTAYDLDKVVEELGENASRYTKKYVTPYGNNGYRDVKAISIHKAIEIVKNGGVDDDVCEWRYNDSEYYFESSCEHLHIFMSDGPKENEYEFCPYCGKKIKEMESD